MAWAPGNNIGPDGNRVSRYNWPTWKNGSELREELTVPGNGGHALLAQKVFLETDPNHKLLVDLCKNAAQTEEHLLKSAGTEVTARARALWRSHGWVSIARVIDDGTEYLANPIDVAATKLIKKDPESLVGCIAP